MIPYDDLVIALTTWRARQGLPVGQMSGALTPPPTAAVPGAVMAPPQRSTGSRPNVPPPMAMPDTHEDSLDVDDAALIEEHQDLGAELSADAYSSETMLDSDIPSSDDTVDSDVPASPRTKPPAW